MQIPPAPPREVYSVSALASTLRTLLEVELPLLWVEGEISGLSRPGSGHLYFTLKDVDAQLRCAMFRQRNMHLRFRPENGQRVRARVRVTLYQPRGDLQLIAEHMEPVGDGELMRAFLELKGRLQAEGLFDAERKIPLPLPIRRVGLITSPSGAVLHDIRRVLARRDPGIAIVIYPVPVQGAEAPARIAAALALAGARQEVDLLVVARGGGSLEDLQAFNDERVARAIATCPLPVVSAVGHETDTTIADFVADLRAPTPSAAAEQISQDQGERRRTLQGLERRLAQGLQTRLGRQRRHLDELERRLQRAHPGRRLEQHAQRLDELGLRLLRQQRRLLDAARQRLEQLEARLARLAPGPRLQQQRQRLDTLEQRLVRGLQGRLAQAERRLAHASHTLQTVSPLATVARGYAIVTDAEGAVVRHANDLNANDPIDVRLAHGRLRARVETTQEE